MSRVVTINEHAHGDDAQAPSYGATTILLPLGRGAADCRTGGREAADPLRSSPSPLEDADRPCTGGNPWFVFGLPKPPSVNRFTKQLGNKSPAVVNWARTCDRYLLTLRPRPRLRGPFEIVVTWDIDQFGRFDCDNRLKPLLDYLQRIEFIENDRWCRRLMVEFGPASLGCRIALRQWMSGGAAGMEA